MHQFGKKGGSPTRCWHDYSFLLAWEQTLLTGLVAFKDMDVTLETINSKVFNFCSRESSQEIDPILINPLPYFSSLSQVTSHYNCSFCDPCIKVWWDEAWFCFLNIIQLSNFCFTDTFKDDVYDTYSYRLRVNGLWNQVPQFLPLIWIHLHRLAQVSFIFSVYFRLGILNQLSDIKLTMKEAI